MWFFTVQLKVLESSDQRVPVASVQETSIRELTGKTVEEHEGLCPRLSWTKIPCFLHDER